MKINMKRIVLTLLSDVGITFIYFLVLTQFFPQIAVARYFLGTWGFGGYLFIVPLLGFMITRKASYKLSLLCSTGIPFLFALTIFLFMLIYPDLVKIPVFNQYYEYNESVRFSTIMGIVIMYCGIPILGLSWIACDLRERRKNSRQMS